MSHGSGSGEYSDAQEHMFPEPVYVGTNGGGLFGATESLGGSTLNSGLFGGMTGVTGSFGSLFSVRTGGTIFGTSG